MLPLRCSFMSKKANEAGCKPQAAVCWQSKPQLCRSCSWTTTPRAGTKRWWTLTTTSTTWKSEFWPGIGRALLLYLPCACAATNYRSSVQGLVQYFAAQLMRLVLCPINCVCMAWCPMRSHGCDRHRLDYSERGGTKQKVLFLTEHRTQQALHASYRVCSPLDCRSFICLLSEPFKILHPPPADHVL